MSGPKSQTWSRDQKLGVSYDIFAGSKTGAVDYGSKVFKGIDELLISEGHPGPPYKTGGQLEVRKAKLSLYPFYLNQDYTISAPLHWTTHAEVWLIPSIGIGPYKGLVPNPSLTVGFGTKGYNRFKPGNPGVNLGQFLAELRDIPRLPFAIRRLGFFRGLGHEYLNVQFGWIPFLSDLRAYVRTYLDLHRRLEQLRRDNGAPVRRSGLVNESYAISNAHSGGSGFPSGLIPTISEGHFVGPWTKDVTTELQSQYRFSGRFRYWIPDIGNSHWNERAEAALFGLNPTPSLLWELLPWSWLVDWVGSVGDIISNISGNAAENLVSDYAYSTEYALTRTSTLYRFGTRQGPGSCASVLEQTSTYRIEASPYGFGATFADFSVRQLAILAALGLTRT